MYVGLGELDVVSVAKDDLQDLLFPYRRARVVALKMHKGRLHESLVVIGP